jgi:GT2 family glycosyltransferase
LFWDLLFFGREGDDLSLRVWDAGYEVLYWPEAIVYHRVSPERRVSGCQRDYFDLRNSLWIYAVRYPWWMLALFLPLRVGVGLVKGIRKGCIGYALLALRDAARQSASLRRQRRPVRNETARHYLHLLREHGPLGWDLASWLRHKA